DLKISYDEGIFLSIAESSQEPPALQGVFRLQENAASELEVALLGLIG
ncbi:hypothetical protein JOD03_001491, partial [Chryseomicrobium aureum]|nr:hypothetical protein [Chryseomicrobium aureum]